MSSQQIVVGIDDSPSSRAALRWAAEQAERAATTLRAVYVFDPPLGLEATGGPFVVEELVYSSDTGVPPVQRANITALFEEVDPRAGWELDFVIGKAGPVLVDAARSAQLLVVGTQEHVGLGRLLAGSTSHYCLSHASCPVVAVPPSASAEPAQQASGSTVSA